MLARLTLGFLIAACFTSCGRESEQVSDWARRIDFENDQLVQRSVLAPPPWPFDDAARFLTRQTSLREQLLDTFSFPGSPAPDVLVLDRETLPAPAHLHRERLVFVSHDGTAIPAVLQYPRHRRQAAAILVIPGHTPASDSGLRQLVEGDDSYQHAASTRLAEAGFTTLAFELRGFGLLGAPLGTEHVHVAFNAILSGSFYKALVVGDARMALALLRSQPGVDSARVGVTGASLGGELAVTLAALDASIPAVAWSSYGGRSGPFPRAAGPRRKQRHYCHVIPGAENFLRREDDMLLIAPRPALGLRGQRDHRPEPGFAERSRDAWALIGNPMDFAFEIKPERGHEFFVEETVAFFEEYLDTREEIPER